MVKGARTVVLVDDTQDVRRLVRRALERHGRFQVIAEAADGSEGVAAARLHRPDVVLLDIAMPVMDGLDALTRIRESLPDAVILMLSGFGAQQVVDQAMRLGADGYIQKGGAMRELVEQVGAALRVKRGPEIGEQGPETARRLPPTRRYRGTLIRPIGEVHA